MGELLVLPDIGRDDPADLFVLQQLPEPYAVDPAVVGDDLKIADPGFDQSVDKDRGDATDPKTTGGDDRALADVRHGLARAGNHLVQALGFVHA